MFQPADWVPLWASRLAGGTSFSNLIGYHRETPDWLAEHDSACWLGTTVGLQIGWQNSIKPSDWLPPGGNPDWLAEQYSAFWSATTGGILIGWQNSIKPSDRLPLGGILIGWQNSIQPSDWLPLGGILIWFVLIWYQCGCLPNGCSVLDNSWWLMPFDWLAGKAGALLITPD